MVISAASYGMVGPRGWTCDKTLTCGITRYPGRPMPTRSRKRVQIGLRIDERDLAALEALADAVYEDRCAFICRILHDYVATHDARECPP